MSGIWYPGHIHQAVNLLKQYQKYCDVFIEVRDSRLPTLTKANFLVPQNKPHIILLNKADSVDLTPFRQWKDKQANSYFLMEISALQSKSLENIKTKLGQIRKYRHINHLFVCIFGYPNIGKSTLINGLTKAKKAKSSATAGQTRHFQSIRLNENISLMDMPGIIDLPQMRSENHWKLELLLKIKPKDEQILYQKSFDYLKTYYLKRLMNRYDLEKTQINTWDSFIELMCEKKNFYLKNKELNFKRAEQKWIQDIFEDKMGKLFWERDKI